VTYTVGYLIGSLSSTSINRILSRALIRLDPDDLECNSFDHIPAAVIGASPASIGTAVGQQSLRAVLGFCNARQMAAPEAYIQPDLFLEDGP
jgi:NAD(P)H-dependent FMN reductase